jgi:hypothetical protein
LRVTTSVEQSGARMKLIKITVRTTSGSFVQEFITAVFNPA